MTNPFLILFCTALLFASCAMDENSKDQSENIDKTTQQAKDLIDELGKSAKEILKDSNGKDIDLQEFLDKLSRNSEGINKLIEENKDEWVEKMEKLKNSPEFEKVVEQFKGNAKEILQELEKAANELDEKTKQDTEK